MTPPADWIPFNRVSMAGDEHANIDAAIAAGHLSADGPFNARCRSWLEQETGCHAALLVHSCTAALEIAALLAEIGDGDEVIMPSYTFVSTANVFARCGATPVFVDIRNDTLNLDESLVEAAITPKTRAIAPVHYAGVGCEMDAVADIAARHGLAVIEDAAQGLLSTYKQRPLGTLAPLGAISFHETKNVTCGEGGALLVNDPSLLERAEILREKGTNRSGFFRGEVERYTWLDVGSSYALSELNTAFLWAQLPHAETITERRLAIWDRYHQGFEQLEESGALRRPTVPAWCHHNAHMYYLLLEDRAKRDALIEHLAERGVNAVFHYIPLHSSPAGRRLGRAHGELRNTDQLSAGIVRLPLWAAMDDETTDAVITATCEFFDRVK
jgi:dTDP-4-amino-4,6-dideoxygalactose transaminase